MVLNHNTKLNTVQQDMTSLKDEVARVSNTQSSMQGKAVLHMRWPRLDMHAHKIKITREQITRATNSVF